MPRFTIVTPSLNQLDLLSLCAASVDDQSEGKEHIIQDGGSTELADWIHRNGSRFPAVRAQREKDAGMYDAINKGLRKATGEICAYLNSDEQYLPETLQRVAQFFDENPKVDILFGDAVLIDHSMTPIGYRHAILPTLFHTMVRPLCTLTCSTFFRRKLVDDGMLFAPEWKIIGDKEWIVRALRRGYRMAVLRAPLALFMFTGHNLSESPLAAKERAHWRRSVPAFARRSEMLLRAQFYARKMMTGGYRDFEGNLAYYVVGEVGGRKQFANLRLKTKWPSKVDGSSLNQ